MNARAARLRSGRSGVGAAAWLVLSLGCRAAPGGGGVASPTRSAGVDSARPHDTGSRDSADDDVDTGDSGGGVDSAPDSVPLPDTGAMLPGDWVDVSAGYWYTCGIRRNGEILCWGDNYGQKDAPEGAFSAVSSTLYLTCALSAEGAPVCWGVNEECCNPADSFSAYVLQQFDVDSTHYATALTVDGQVLFYVPPGADPYPAPAGTYIDVAGHWSTAVAIDAAGAPTFFGEFAAESSALDLPVRFANVSGGSAMCGVDVDGTMYAWEADRYGVSVRLRVAGDYRTCAGSPNSPICAIRADGHVDCFFNSPEPRGTSDMVVPPPHATFSKVSVGGYHTCGVTTSGWMKCWGWNNGGESDPPVDGDHYFHL